ncbi:MAG: LysM peptidoglycan-binding domain-containing protein [Bdellovibrionales bacterium]|nr:LysM peptidoglycan-binding domain-containing protein [Bdellovibrionales bacterium]
MKRASLIRTTLYASAAFAALTLASHRIWASPESESARIAGNLRAYSDDDWMKIAGERATEKYEVARGDTLWDISERLFGDAKVWPKIWEINNTTILNPHMIEPRMALLFSSGSGTSLPSLAVTNTGAGPVGDDAISAAAKAGGMTNTGTTTVKNHYTLSKDDRPGPVWDEKTPYPSKEWQKLPRQSWENVEINLPGNIDKDGFDTHNRIYLRKPATGLEVPHFVSCSPIKPLAKIVGSRLITSYVTRGAEITITADAPLEVNTSYTLLDANPSNIEAGDRKALSYDILGRVKILGVQSGTYVGEIQNSRETIPRGALLVPEIKRIERPAPVAGASKVTGTILSDRRTGAFMSGQYKWVYINRGTRDGVQPGMLFRIFQNQDPKTGLALTKGDVFVSGDAQVFQGCEDFSIGLFIWSRGEVPEMYEGQLLTDLADEKVRFYFNGEASDIPTKEEAALTPPSGVVDAPKPEPTTAIIGPGPTAPTENAPEETVLTPPPPEELQEKEALKPGMTEEKKTAEEEDWLDKLDNHKELQGDEENELRELEKFHETETAKAPKQELPETAPAPDGTSDLPPPPPESDLPPAPPAEAAAPAAPDSSFPSEEPVVETPSTVVNPNPPTKSAKAPKAPSAEPPAGNPFESETTDGLPPL